MRFFAIIVQQLLKELAPSAHGPQQHGTEAMRIWQYFGILPRVTINTSLKHHNSYSNFRGEEVSCSTWLDTGCHTRFKG